MTSSGFWRTAARRLGICAVILIGEFVVLEAGLRMYGGSEASPAFQSLFMQDPQVGHRPRPNAHARYTTVEFSTDLAINPQGVRDDEPIGPKAPDERRILVLGDSLVLSVQVPLVETFGKRLEARLQATGDGRRWRVINGGVQGYGPVQEWLFFDHVAAAFQPDIVLVVVFVGNDAVEAYDSQSWLEAGQAVRDESQTVGSVRRLLRGSVVWQLARRRWDQLQTRLSTPAPERPLASYLVNPPPEIGKGWRSRARPTSAWLSARAPPARRRRSRSCPRDFRQTTPTMADSSRSSGRPAARLNGTRPPIAFVRHWRG